MHTCFFVSIVAVGGCEIARFWRAWQKAIKIYISLLLLLFGGACLPIANAQQSALTCGTSIKLMANTVSGGLASNFVQATSTTGLSSWSNASRIIDNNVTNNATATIAISGSVTVRVTDTTNNYNAGNFAGYVVQNGLANIALGSGVVITTYLNGVSQESKQTSGLLSLASSISGTSQLGFYTNKPFDAVELQISATIGAGSYDVYYAFMNGMGSCTSASLQCNRNTYLSSPNYAAVVMASHTGVTGVALSALTNIDSLVDASTANYASFTATLSLIGTGFVSVKDVVADYPAGTFAGYDIENTNLISLGILNGISIKTFRNDTLQETVTGSSLILGATLMNATGRQTIGFVATKSFDEVQILFNQGALSVDLGTTRIYGAVIKQFCAGTALSCNTPVSLNERDYPVVINAARSGITGAACALCVASGFSNVIDTIAINYASLNTSVATGVQASLSVKTEITDYAAGTFAGFDIETASLLNLNLLNNITITTYRNDTLIETKTGSAQGLLSLSTSLLSNANRQKVGFVSNNAFDEVRISIFKTLLADLGTVKVFNAIVEAYCPATLMCSSSYRLTKPAFPVFINSTNTGYDGAVCALCSLTNPESVIDNDTTNNAILTTVAGVLSPVSLSVKDAKSKYPIGTFAGFNIQSLNGLLQLDLFNTITIATYRNDTLQETQSAGNLLNLTLLSNVLGNTSGRYNIGFVTTKQFDEIKISVGGNLSVANIVAVYGVVIDTRSSVGGSLICKAVWPDINVGLLKQTVTGSVATNDKVIPFSKYSNSLASSSNPTGAVLIMDSIGNYIFTDTQVGVYNYYITVCDPGQVSGCSVSLLTITITSPDSLKNSPIINTDYATLKGAPSSPASTTIFILANDRPGNKNGSLSTPLIITNSVNGNASVNASGKIIYTPNAGFYGNDSLVYQVCDTTIVPAKCALAKVYLRVLNIDATNLLTADDDYHISYNGATISGNVMLNDNGLGTLNVISDTITIAGKGTLIVNDLGAYTFSPENGFEGGVSFTYYLKDTANNGDSATVYISSIIERISDLAAEHFFSTTNFIRNQEHEIVIRIRNFGQGVTSDKTTFYVSKPISSLFTISVDSNAHASADVPAVSALIDNAKWIITEQATRYKFETATSIPSLSNLFVVIKVRANGSQGSSGVVTTTILGGTGGNEVQTSNNAKVTRISIQ